MNENDIDTAARAYVEAATALADTLLAKLEVTAPDIAARAAQALQAGERMQLLLEFHLESPSIVWQIVDDYEKPKRLMTVPSRMPRRH